MKWQIKLQNYQANLSRIHILLENKKLSVHLDKLNSRLSKLSYHFIRVARATSPTNPIKLVRHATFLSHSVTSRRSIYRSICKEDSFCCERLLQCNFFRGFHFFSDDFVLLTSNAFSLLVFCFYFGGVSCQIAEGHLFPTTVATKCVQLLGVGSFKAWLLPMKCDTQLREA